MYNKIRRHLWTIYMYSIQTNDNVYILHVLLFSRIIRWIFGQSIQRYTYTRVFLFWNYTTCFYRWNSFGTQGQVCQIRRKYCIMTMSLGVNIWYRVAYFSKSKRANSYTFTWLLITACIKIQYSTIFFEKMSWNMFGVNTYNRHWLIG